MYTHLEASKNCSFWQAIPVIENPFIYIKPSPSPTNPRRSSSTIFLDSETIVEPFCVHDKV